MSRRTTPLTKNIELIGFDDLNNKPGFQMALQKVNGRYYLYVASYRHNGWNILDVTNPEKPRNIKWMEGPWMSDVHEGQSSFKIQIADGIMMVAHGGTVPFLHGTERGLPYFGGVTFYDVHTDPENPKFLSKFACPNGPGAHRCFYNGGRYAYISGCDYNYKMYFFRILDIVDPKKPVEVGRWWASEQYTGDKLDLAQNAPKNNLQNVFLHACTVKNDIAYLAYPNKGMVLLDIKDKTRPQLISCLPLNPTFGGGSSGAPVHTAMPLGDRPYAIVTTEGERARFFGATDIGGHFPVLTTQPMNMIGMVELTDIQNPSLISIFPYPEVPEGYTHGTNFNFVDGVRVPFGPHNMFDAFGPEVYEHRDDRVYNCYFHAGLRIYDVSDPFVPKEIAYFLPPDPEVDLFNNKEGTLFPGEKIAITEDVLVDDRGYIYVDTFMDGLYIVRCTV